MNLSFIGSGNVATHLALAFQKAGNPVLSVHSKNHKHAVEFAKKITGCFPAKKLSDINCKSEIIFLCVTDDALNKIISRLDVNPKIALVHTSGSLPASVFSNLSNPCGVFYPLQTFSKDIPVSFSKVPVFIESPNRNLLKKLKSLVQCLGSSVIVENSIKRAILHLSAVFASNFTNHLLTIASRVLKKNHLDFNMLHSLINETVRKALLYGPEKVQTGPAFRHDLKIIKQHLKLLRKNTTIKELYKKLSRSIMESVFFVIFVIMLNNLIITSQ